MKKYRNVLLLLCILVWIPLTIWVGTRFFGDRKYLVISILIACYTLIPFFLLFERRKPQAREIMVIAVMISLAVAGRAAFYMVPGFKPVAAIVIITGISLGAETGVMVGAMSMFLSNMFFGQGPWTPWQMLAMGLIGLLAGVLFSHKKPQNVIVYGIYGFLAVLIFYGGIMNPASLLMMSYEINPQNLLAIYASGIWMDLVHAAGTLTFLWIAARPMLDKLERIKVKYGLLERG